MHVYVTDYFNKVSRNVNYSLWRFSIIGKHKRKSFTQQYREMVRLQHQYEDDNFGEDAEPEVTYHIDTLGYLTVYYHGEEIGTYHDKNYWNMPTAKVESEVDEIVEDYLSDR